jgi:YD repeat-containing protein
MKEISWPQSFGVTFALAETDMGGLGDFVDELLQAIKDDVVEYIAGIAAGAVTGAAILSAIPLVGTLVGALAGALLAAMIDLIGDWAQDDVFDPVTISITIPSANASWQGGGLESPEQTVEFKGHGGTYELTYDWRLYRDFEGFATLLKGRRQGAFTPVHDSGALLPTWARIVPGAFSRRNATDLLFYDAVSGTAEFHQALGESGLKLLAANEGWRETWSIIVPGRFSEGGLTDLLFYDASHGTLAFYKSTGQGSLQLLKEHSGRRKSWLFIIPGDFSPHALSDLLFYDPILGEVEIYSTDGRGNLDLVKRHTGWEHTWTAVAYARRRDMGWLFLYDAGKGRAMMYLVYGAGGLLKLREYEGLPRTWDQIIPGRFGGSRNSYAEWLCYDTQEGEATAYEIDLHGNLTRINTNSGKRWKGMPGLLVPISLAGNTYTDLFRYRVGRPIPWAHIEGPGRVQTAAGETASVTLRASFRNLAAPLDITWSVSPRQRPPIQVSYSNDRTQLNLEELQPAVYTVKLAITDSFGEEASAKKYVTVVMPGTPP